MLRAHRLRGGLVVRPRCGRLGDPCRGQDVLAVQVAQGARVLRDRQHLVVDDALLPDPRHVVVRDVCRTVRREIEQLAAQANDEMNWYSSWTTSGPLPAFDGGAHLCVVIQALADVLDRDVDLRVLLLEQVDLILNVGHPGPEGQVGRRVQRFFVLRIRDRTGGAARASGAAGGAARVIRGRTVVPPVSSSDAQPASVMLPRQRSR